MLRVALINEQLRRTVPGGIGTYIRGVQAGIRELEPDEIALIPWASRLPVPVRSRLWDYGIGRVKGDVVHSPSLNAPRRGKSPLVVAIHDVAWRDTPGAFPDRGRRWHERAFARAAARADAFVVPAPRAAEALRDAGVPDDRIFHIEYGSDHLPAPDVAAAKRIIDGPYILTASTREPRKNLDRLIGAFTLARPALPDGTRLAVVGPAGWGSDAAPADGVVFAGAVPWATLAGLYAGALAFAYVPLLEGFGLPPVEAMRAGLPVLTSNRVPSSVGVALEVDPLDVDAIASGLVAVVGDDNTRRALTEAGTRRASELTWRATAAAHVDIWTAVGSR